MSDSAHMPCPSASRCQVVPYLKCLPASRCQVVPYLKNQGLRWTLEGRSAARQALLTHGLLPVLAAPAPSGEGEGAGSSWAERQWWR